ncbi:MAG: uroporphyrinogen-III synthase [Gammaproteobacteria bacterium]|nr:uroporphyrinogen-III synthase [Gammaproteobacteria bacterium]
MSTPETDLSGITVAVTRPAHQAESLCHSIQALGGTALRLPVIAIGPCTAADAQRLAEQLRRLDEYQLAIFISANAVSATLQQLPPGQVWPATVAIAAVGQATARAINAQGSAHGLVVSLVSPEPYNSEALLSLEPMQNLQGQRVIIFRGKGGREWLGDTLQARGATVEYAECYQRVTPATDMSPLFQLWEAAVRVPIVVTSNEGLENLHAMVGESHLQSLLKSPLIVVSQRAVDLAESLGFKQKPVVAKTASDEALLSAIKWWKRHER